MLTQYKNKWVELVIAGDRLKEAYIDSAWFTDNGTDLSCEELNELTLKLGDRLYQEYAENQQEAAERMAEMEYELS